MPAPPLIAQSVAAKLVPGGLLAPYASGGAQQETIHVRNLKAVVAIAPWGGSVGMWGPAGHERHHARRCLLIAGDHDHSVDYATGARNHSWKPPPARGATC